MKEASEITRRQVLELAALISTDIFMSRTGLPFTPTISSDNANTGVGGQRPSVIGDPSVAHPSPTLWFNPAAFAIPARYTYENGGRNILRADGLQELDVTLKK